MKLVRKIYDGVKRNRRPPENLGTGDDVYFGGAPFLYATNDCSLFEINEATVTNHGIIYERFSVLKRFIVCYESDFSRYRYKYFIRTFFLNRKSSLNQSKKFLIVFDNYSGPNGFFHWISDGLTKLVEINDILKDYTVIFPDYFRKENLYIETLSWFDFHDVVFIPDHSSYKIKKLNVMSHVAPTGVYLRENVLKLRSHVYQKLGLTKNTIPKRKIYVSRAKADRRFVLNENLVVDLLKKYEFEVHHFQEYTIAEQVELMNDCSVLVSIHGAALTNLMFMNTGTSVLEFRLENDYANCCYYALACEVGVKYFYQFCEGESVSDVANNFNLSVDLKKLEDNLKLIHEVKS